MVRWISQNVAVMSELSLKIYRKSITILVILLGNLISVVLTGSAHSPTNWQI